MSQNIETLAKDTQTRMDNAIEHFKKYLGGLRTGKASPALVADIQVEIYGSRMPLKGAAAINTPDARTIAIQAFDPSTVPAIEKAIIAANIGIMPMFDGKVIRLPMPELTEERRKEMVKQMKNQAEDHKIEIRNIRRDSNERIKKGLKDGLSEDAGKTLEKDIQKITDNAIKTLDTLITGKEKDLMTV